jgi:AsmA protein
MRRAPGRRRAPKVTVKRWTKVLLAIGSLVVLAAVSLPVFVNANTFRPAIEKQLTTTLGRSVKLGDLKLPPFSGSLVARDVSVADDPNFSAAPFLTAKEVLIGVSLRHLIFSRQANLRSFQIESPQINVIRAANGTWNFSSIGRIPTSISTSGTPKFGAAGSAGTGISNGSATELPDLSVGRIVIEDGRAVVTTLPALGAPSVYERVNLTAHDFSFAVQFPFELNAELPAGGTISTSGHIGPINREDAATSPADAQISVKALNPVAAGFLSSEAGVSLVADIEMHAASDGQTLTTDGTIHLLNLKLRKGAAAAPKPLDLAYRGTHRLKENTGEIQDASAKIGAAEIHASGTYQPALNSAATNAASAQDPLLNLKLAGQSLPVDELQPLMTAAGIRLPNGSQLKGGTLAMNLAVTGQARALVISGPIALDQTRLVGFDIGSKIHGIAALSGMKTGDTTEFEKLRVNVQITNAGVVVRRIEAVIPAMGELTGSGTVSPADQLDFNLNLVMTGTSATGIGKVGVGLLTKLNGSGGSSGVPLRVTGTSDEPYITADVGGIVGKKTKSIASFFGKKK